MDDEPASGIERAVFGAMRRDTVDDWLSGICAQPCKPTCSAMPREVRRAMRDVHD